MSGLGAPFLESASPRGGAEGSTPIRRGIYILPSLFTIGTLICGYVAMLSTLKGAELLATAAGAAGASAAFDEAACLIGWAIVFDGLDGRIARLTNSTSNFGREFDSLADVITFGMAPAFLAYSWGVQAVHTAYMHNAVYYFEKVGWLVGFAFVICGAARLARFNIDRGPSSDRRYFVGLPIPGGAGAIAAVVHWAKEPIQSASGSIVWVAIVALTAYLMVSRVRYPSFKGIDLRKKRSYLFIIVLGLIVWAIWAYSEPVLLAIAAVYFLSGPVLRVVSHWHQRPPSPKTHESPGREVHVT
jgi:CDP-diacylglycerol---serine O-phosphatidyltransferase